MAHDQSEIYAQSAMASEVRRDAQEDLQPRLRYRPYRTRPREPWRAPTFPELVSADNPHGTRYVARLLAHEKQHPSFSQEDYHKQGGQQHQPMRVIACARCQQEVSTRAWNRRYCDICGPIVRGRWRKEHPDE